MLGFSLFPYMKQLTTYLHRKTGREAVFTRTIGPRPLTAATRRTGLARDWESKFFCRTP
jgi:hypothetical protein